jgi:photosystem I subunit 11
MIINKAARFNFLLKDTYLSSDAVRVAAAEKKSKEPSEVISSDVVSPFQGDIFVGHLSTPITTSNLTKTYLGLLPAYKPGLSPLLRGINVGFAHGYFLLGPFVKLGPLRDSEVATFVGFISTVSLIIILTTGLLAYGFVTFSEDKENKTTVDFLNPKGWSQFTSGFIIGGVSGASIGFVLLKLVGTSLSAF